MGKKNKQHSEQKQKRILAKSGDRCWYCSGQLIFECVNLGGLMWNQFHLDHVIPRTQGGSNDDSNLVATCKRCNIMKSNRTLEEFRLSLSIRKNSNPKTRAFFHIQAALNELEDARKQGLSDFASQCIKESLSEALMELGIRPTKISFYGECPALYTLAPLERLGVDEEDISY